MVIDPGLQAGRGFLALIEKFKAQLQVSRGCKVQDKTCPGPQAVSSFFNAKLKRGSAAVNATTASEAELRAPRM
jgi:hypothetical protein